MKYLLLFTLGAFLAGCGSDAEMKRELQALKDSNEQVRKELDSLKIEVQQSTKRVRWATVRNQDVSSAIYKLTTEFIRQARKAEKLTTEQERQFALYEQIQRENMHLSLRSIPLRTLRVPPSAGSPPEEDPEVAAARAKLEEAKKPIADIITRLDQLSARYRDEYAVEKMVSAYCKGQNQFDLVVDPSYHKILFQAEGEVPDITQAVVAFVQQHIKPLAIE